MFGKFSRKRREESRDYFKLRSSKEEKHRREEGEEDVKDYATYPKDGW